MNIGLLLHQMPIRDNITGYPPMRESKESQYSHPPREGSGRGRIYHQDEHSHTGHVQLPPISPYETYPSHPQGYPQDQHTYSESYQVAATPAYSADYTRVNSQGGYGPSAPRQRTAIACRYCRRRKIRCSGFDQNPDGRCLNCQRFQQECIFTPVSSQAQAFVPAHAVYPSMRNMGIGPDGRPRMLYQGAPLYGAHGQPLPPPVIHQASSYDYPAPSPTSSYSPYSADERGSKYTPDPSRVRMHHEPHGPTILPPISGQIPSYPRTDNVLRGQFDDDLRLPPVTPTATSPATAHSPGSSHSINYSGPPYPPNPQHSNTIDIRNDPMRLGTIMESRLDSEIDRNMLGRLGRRR
ncbi:hypothetical protein HI914_02827 [Erysiphe necator]|uniref:Putative c6 zinc finger domain-containing protein n=1 Tax=Uncinula necator TaxID=52586 RepID=A0A0B1PCP1_UNCNE|nr:hypothetical protein HI914_02827 [Erysiphe necator]KHJ35120.1 putative c6 zinc finger domain-containing protein [Erysiphe necator]